jgi:SH3 domain-containing YSC84-like protein 1
MKRAGHYGPIQIATFILVLTLSPGLFALSCSAARADDMMDARHLVERSQQTLENFSQAREMAAFRNLLPSARGIFVAPQTLRAAFFVGASGGSGVFVSRDRLKQTWAGPAFYTIGGVSIGFQWGGDASEIILLAMTERGVNSLLESSFKLGADVGLAVGPVGMGAAAATANLSADIISFSRSKGLYGGISLDGAVVKTRRDWNDAYYGSITTPSDILLKRTVQNPHSSSLLKTVSQLSGSTPEVFDLAPTMPRSASPAAKSTEALPPLEPKRGETDSEE